MVIITCVPIFLSQYHHSLEIMELWSGAFNSQSEDISPRISGGETFVHATKISHCAFPFPGEENYNK